MLNAVYRSYSENNGLIHLFAILNKDSCDSNIF
jgi:hypothetical protein